MGVAQEARYRRKNAVATAWRDQRTGGGTGARDAGMTVVMIAARRIEILARAGEIKV